MPRLQEGGEEHPECLALTMSLSPKTHDCEFLLVFAVRLQLPFTQWQSQAARDTPPLRCGDGAARRRVRHAPRPGSAPLPERLRCAAAVPLFAQITSHYR